MKAGIEVEVLKDVPEKLHIFPRESRRGKAQWAIWIHLDGSGILFAGNDQIVLPKNAPGKVTGLHLRRNEEGQMEFLPGEFEKIMCSDSACSLMNVNQHEFGIGCRLYDPKKRNFGQ